MLNIVLLLEGYQAADLPTFRTDVTAFSTALFATAPFDDVRWAINIHRIDVTSTDTGADDPATCPDGTAGAGATPATYFDASFCNHGIRRALTADEDLVINVDAGRRVPAWQPALVLVDGARCIWGGTGGTVGVFSRAGNWTDVAIHELGHSLFDLADEYEYFVGCGLETDHDRPPSADEPPEPNIAATIKRTMISGGIIDANTALPTTANANCTQCDSQANSVPADTVGAFEGAGYYHCGLYRPQFDCMMRNAGTPFCAVCSQHIRYVMRPFTGPYRNTPKSGAGNPSGDFDGDGRSDWSVWRPHEGNWHASPAEAATRGTSMGQTR